MYIHKYARVVEGRDGMGIMTMIDLVLLEMYV